MENAGKTSNLLLKVFSVLLALSLAFNIIQLFKKGEMSEAGNVLVADNRSMIQKLNQYKSEIGRYRGISSRIDEIVNEANLKMEEKEKQISRLARQKKVVEEERQILIQQADSLKELYLNVVDSLLVEREARKSINRKIGQLEEVISGLNKKLGNAELLVADNFTLRPVRVTVTGNRKPTALAKRINSIDLKFDLAANRMAAPGNRNLYIVLTSPEGKILADAKTGKLIEFRHPEYAIPANCSLEDQIKYENQTISFSTTFVPDQFLPAGLYIAEVFTDDNKLAMTTFTLR